jgi:hypothetical protein
VLGAKFGQVSGLRTTDNELALSGCANAQVAESDPEVFVMADQPGLL